MCNTVKRITRQDIEWKKVFENIHLILVSTVYRELLKLNNKKQMTQCKNWEKSEQTYNQRRYAGSK